MPSKDNIIQGPEATASPRTVLKNALKCADEIEAIVILIEFKDATASMSWSTMLKRDLWWNVSNACARLYKILGEG